MVAPSRSRPPQFLRRVQNRPAVRRKSNLAVFAQLMLVASGVGIGGAIGWFAYDAMMSTETFRLRDLALEGTPESLRDRVRTELSPAFGSNLLVLDLEPLRRRVERIPEVQSATIRRLLPGTVEVGVVARRTWGRVVAEDGDWAVSRDGIVLGPARGIVGPGLDLVIECPLGPALDATRRLPANLPGIGSFVDAVRIAEWLQAEGVGQFGTIGALRLDPRGVILLSADGQPPVLVGSATALGDKAERLRALAQQDPPDPTSLVDLRYRDMVVVREPGEESPTRQE